MDNIRNLLPVLGLFITVIEDLIESISSLEEIPIRGEIWITVDSFYRHFPDLVQPRTLREKLEDDSFFTHFSGFNKEGHKIFSPIRMLHHIKNNSPFENIRSRCCEYLKDTYK
jgi:hypothetical protein